MVDNEDFEELNKHKWYAHDGNCTFYAHRHSIINGKDKTILMHRVISKTPTGLLTDHIDGNGLNNQKKNLRDATHSQNLQNRKKHKNNTSGYRGVSWNKDTKKWAAIVGVNGKYIYLGLFTSKNSANKICKETRKKYYGEFSNN